MSNIAIILAGGIGSRVGAEIPKQFVEINDIPLIIHTIKRFQENQDIDSIIVVCVCGWEATLEKLVHKFSLNKVKKIVQGGSTSFESTKNGLFSLKGELSATDYVVIHDAARPILPQQAIQDLLNTAKRYGNAALALPCYETILKTEDGISGLAQINRDNIMRVQTPQAYLFKDLVRAFELAIEEDNTNFVYANLVYLHYIGEIYFSKGFAFNIKITTPSDFEVCRSLMSIQETSLL